MRATATVPCVVDQATCATGLAEWSTNYYVCPLDVPTGAVPNGGGEYCYDTFRNCQAGPNACGLDTPCEYDTATVQHGAGGRGAVCQLVLQRRGASRRRRTTARASVATTTSRAALPAPIGATRARATKNNATCSSGVSAGQGTVVFCDQTQPPGAIPNGAGMLCYNESSWCLLGPNACGVSPVPGAVVVGGTTLSDGTQLGGAAFNGSAVRLGTLSGERQCGEHERQRGGWVCHVACCTSDTNFSVGLATACPVNGSAVNATVLGESLGTAVGSPVYSGANMLGVVDPLGLGTSTVWSPPPRRAATPRLWAPSWAAW
jgi:hypothetical protein